MCDLVIPCCRVFRITKHSYQEFGLSKRFSFDLKIWIIIVVKASRVWLKLVLNSQLRLNFLLGTDHKNV